MLQRAKLEPKTAIISAVRDFSHSWARFVVWVMRNGLVDDGKSGVASPQCRTLNQVQNVRRPDSGETHGYT